MVTTRFIGRLGNSMFQLAAAIAYAKRYGYEWAAPFDARESSIHRVFPNLPKTYDHPRSYPKNGYDEMFYNFYEIGDQGDDVLLQGFFQSEKFFENAKEEVKKVFELDHYPEYEGYVSIHVRRGDYTQHSESFPPITLEYLAMAFQEVNVKKAIVFSDDINWCKDNILHEGFDLEFSQGINERQDLSIMSSCSHHIIANSSFSWWGAYLGRNPDKKIICPSHKTPNWYGHGNSVKDPKDLIPDSWIQIEFR